MEPNPECGPDGATPNSGHRVLPLFGALVELRLDYVSPWGAIKQVKTIVPRTTFGSAIAVPSGDKTFSRFKKADYCL